GEVVWWLAPTGTSTVTPDATPGQPLYVLRRRQRALWPLPNTAVSDVPDSLSEVSGPPTPAGGTAPLNGTVRGTGPALRLGGPARAFRGGRPPIRGVKAGAGGGVANPDTRYGGVPTAPAQPYPQNTVEDIVIGDVLSFDVRVLVEGATEFEDLSGPTVQSYNT